MNNWSKYLLIAALCLQSCSGSSISIIPERSSVQVGFWAGGSGDTRTAAGQDGLSTHWNDNDSIALWASDRKGTQILDNCIFHTYGISQTNAFFTAELDAPMPEGTYRYIACCPPPSAVQGRIFGFRVPSEQDGICSDGGDILISSEETAPALKEIDWQSGNRDFLRMRMHHIMHRVRFICSRSAFGGETVRRIVAIFPQEVTGDIQYDADRQSTVIVRDGSASVDIRNSSESETVLASVVPVTFRQGEILQVKAYTSDKVAVCNIPLRGRSFRAGHSTPIRITPESIREYHSIVFTLASNKLGENPETVTITSPCALGNGSNTVTLKYGRDISEGNDFELGFENTEEFRALSGKQLTVTYDAPHATVSQTVMLPDLSESSSANVELTVPCLLEEDFSTVGTFSSHDTYGISSAGSKDAVIFLDGWSGGRIGAQEGTSIRIACRRETSADYDARVDTAPLTGKLKAGAVLKVEFDYGSDEEHGGILSSAVGQDCYVGYTTSTEAFKSGSTSGNFDRTLNTFYTAATSGSYTSTPEHAVMFLNISGTPETVRICIRTEIEHMAGMNNGTNWLYIDNVMISLGNE